MTIETETTTTTTTPGSAPNGQGGADHAAAAEATPPANDDAGRSPQQQPAEAADEAAELRDRLLRTLAEMENLRARTAREVEDARKYAATGFARDLLDAADNLRRALASVPEGAREGSEFVGNLVLGVEMTERSLLGAFEKHRVRRVEPARGERFDPNLHQAMFEVPTDQLPAGTVAEVMQPGYVIADRLLRPALVGVAKAGSDSAAGQGDPAAATAAAAGR